jgi:hypothetical protein
MVGAFGGEMAFIKATSIAKTPCGIESECILSVISWVSSSALAWRRACSCARSPAPADDVRPPAG